VNATSTSEFSSAVASAVTAEIERFAEWLGLAAVHRP
jgi:hypothetical protein